MVINMNSESQILHTLKIIGLSNQEANIYLTTLKIGPNPASTVARVAKINRSSCYLTLQKLSDKGLINKIPNKITYFTAKNPKHILSHLTNIIEDLNIRASNLQIQLSNIKGPSI